MKNRIFLIALLMCFAAYTKAQIIVQTTQASSKKIKEWFIAYRGSLEETFVVSSLGRVGCNTVMTHGLQVHPRVWIGMGLGYSYQIANGKKVFPTIKTEDLYYYGYRFSNSKYEDIDQTKITSITRNTFSVYYTHDLLWYPEVKVNLFDPATSKLIPYLSAAVGLRCITLSAYSHLRAGVNYLAPSQKFGVSAFVGLSTFANEYRQDWSVYYAVDSGLGYTTDYLHIDSGKYVYGVFLNMGVAIEFGGVSGFKPRVKKNKK